MVLHPDTRPFERPSAAQRAQESTEYAIHPVEKREQVQPVSRVVACPPHQSWCDIEAIEMNVGKARVTFCDLDRGKPERVVPAKVCRCPTSWQPGVQGLQRLSGPFARLGEDRPDARRSCRENVEPSREKRALTIIGADDEWNGMGTSRLEGIEGPFRQELAIDDRTQCDGAGVPIRGQQLHSRGCGDDVVDARRRQEPASFIGRRAIGARIVCDLAEQLDELACPLCGHVAGIDRVGRRTLRDRPGEKPCGRGNGHESCHRISASRLSKERDIRCVSPEIADIVPNPLECRQDVAEPEIAFHGPFGC